MYTTVDMRELQDRLDNITTKVAEEKVATVTPEVAPESQEIEVSNGPDFPCTIKKLNTKNSPPSNDL